MANIVKKTAVGFEGACTGLEVTTDIDGDIRIRLLGDSKSFLLLRSEVDEFIEALAYVRDTQ